MTEESNAALAEDEALDTEIENIEAESEAPEATASPDTEATSETAQVIEIDDNQKAINKLAFEKREEKRLRKAAEDRIRELEASQALPQAVEKPTMPTQAEYDYDDDKYNAAMDEYQSGMVQYQVQQTLSQQQRS
jgi:glyoxylate carboligase